MSKHAPPAQSGHTAGARLPDLYRTDATHGWSIGMRAITGTLLADLKLPPGPILELGCGAGALLPDIQRAAPNNAAIGADVHPLALAYAKTNAPGVPLLQSDLHAVPLPNASVAAILLLDTLDQNGVDASRALREAARILRPAGAILARVSALPWLYGPHDPAYNTRRRYSPCALRAEFAAAGFQVQRVTYANALLGTLAVVPRLLQRWRVLRWNERQTTAGPRARVLFATTLAAEARWLRRADLPFGLSLYVIARRDAATDRTTAHAPAKVTLAL